MKLRSFGDSWYWSWYYRKPFKSLAIRSTLHQESGLPTLESFLKFYGVDCHTENEPGCTFYRTVEKITQECSVDPVVDYNIVFFSNLVRGDNWKNHTFDFTNYQSWMKKWKQDCYNLFVQLEEWSKRNNQKILLIGGQCTLPNDVLESLNLEPNIFVLAECVSYKILKEYAKVSVNKPFGIFKCSRDFSHFADNTWDKQLVNEIYEDQHYYDQTVNKEFLTNDYYHLSAIGHLYLTDIIIDKIEYLEKRK